MNPAKLDNYLPIQPSVKSFDQGVLYREIFPTPALSTVIFCYWQLKTEKPLTSPFTYNVVADGCIDIFFELNDAICPYVMGFASQNTTFDLPKTFNYIGVRFLPSFFPQLFDVPAYELSNKYLPLSDIQYQTASYITNTISPNESLEAIAAKLDTYFVSYCSKVKWFDDSRFYNALKQIISRRGMISLHNDLDTGLSIRQLRRLFHQYVGDSPKAFSQVVRFQSTLHTTISKPTDMTKSFYSVGYFDQAHFIKEFKKFYGLTPKQAFAG